MSLGRFSGGDGLGPALYGFVLLDELGPSGFVVGVVYGLGWFGVLVDWVGFHDKGAKAEGTLAGDLGVERHAEPGALQIDVVRGCFR